MEYQNLSTEQQQFIDLALQGKNILVDACIGSGKTTTIQCLCNMIKPEKQILYLTYNRLLKLDAQSRITSDAGNIRVTNFHGFSGEELLKYGKKTSIEQAVADYNAAELPLPKLDVLILDEYQDLEQEFADMLRHIKQGNPNIQIVAVGDLAQKISDKTRLEVEPFMSEFLGEKNLQRMEFTQCFRLSRGLAAMLGAVWSKKITGVNPNCSVCTMSFREALEYLKKCEPKEVLCLGANNNSLRNTMLNYLEKECSEKYNKFTVWSKISEKDGGATAPTKDTAIFTTYDGCKGMERDVCVVFDWTESYWHMRLNMPDTKFRILRNIFCVAASRGKKKIIFVKANDLLQWKTLMNHLKDNDKMNQSLSVSHMFDFKYIEDVNDAYSQLDIQEIAPPVEAIDVPTSEGMIDLSPCIGMYQEVSYFDGSSVEEYIRSFFEHNPKALTSRGNEMQPDWTLDQKVLFAVSLETEQNRYMHQVALPLIKASDLDKIHKRLATLLPHNAAVQFPCQIDFIYKDKPISIYGFADVIHDDIIYELKFVSELTHTHFLQCAMYMASSGIKKGILWNVRNNQRYEIYIPDVKKFLDKAIYAATKGRIHVYENPADTNGNSSGGDKPKKSEKRTAKKAVKKTPGKQPAAMEILTQRPLIQNTKAKPNGSNCKEQFSEFCRQNMKECRKIARLSKRAKEENKNMGPVRIERAFQDAGISLPFSARTFAKYWKEYCEAPPKACKKQKNKKNTA